MNKSDLVDRIAAGADLTKKDAAAALDEALKAISEALKAGEGVALAGFGSYEVRARAARAGRNPQTGEAITIAATNVVSFKPGKALKDAVNG